MIGTICPFGWNRVNVLLSLKMWKANYNGFSVMTSKHLGYIIYIYIPCSHLVLKLLSKVKTKWEIFSNFCGSHRISEL